MEVSFEVLLLSIVVWVVALLIIRGVRCCRCLVPLYPLCVLISIVCLTVWPLPIAVMLGYTASVISLPIERELTCRICFMLGNLLLLFFVVVALPNPFSEDGESRRPVILYCTWSPGFAAFLLTLIFAATPMVRIHYIYRWMSNGLNYIGLLLLVSGLRRLVGSVVDRNVVVGIQGALYLLAFACCRTNHTYNAWTRYKSTTRETIVGVGVYVAMVVSLPMMILDDGVSLETHQWVALVAGFMLVASLQYRPARRFLRDYPPEYPNLQARYSRMLPHL